MDFSKAAVVIMKRDGEKQTEAGRGRARDRFIQPEQVHFP